MQQRQLPRQTLLIVSTYHPMLNGGGVIASHPQRVPQRIEEDRADSHCAAETRTQHPVVGVPQVRNLQRVPQAVSLQGGGTQ